MLSIENVKHIIFDFDGVIVDSENKKFSDLQEVLSTYNYTLNDSEFRNFIGKKRGAFLREKGLSNIEEIMEQIHEIDKDFREISIVSGLKEFLSFLQEKKIKMHIATGSSKKFVEALLEKHDISKYFTEILTGDDIKESKPNSRVYLEMKQRLNDNNILVIEDSPAGVESAKKAGLFVIGLGENLNADIEFLSYTQIIGYLK